MILKVFSKPVHSVVLCEFIVPINVTEEIFVFPISCFLQFMRVYFQFVWGEGVNNCEWQVWKSNSRAFHLRQFLKNKHEKVAFVSLTYSIVFTFLLDSFLSVFFSSPNWSSLLHSPCYTSKFQFQSSEQTNLIISIGWNHLPFMTCTFQHLSVPSVTSQRSEISSLNKSDVSPLSMCFFSIPELVHINECAISGWSSQNLFPMMGNPLCHFEVAVCCLVLTSTESLGVGFDRQVILCQKSWTLVCVWPCNL